MKTDTAPEKWRGRYQDSLRTLEGVEQRARAMEVSLKRLAGRLCAAALGQSSQLDAEIRRLQAVMRRESSSEELDQIMPTLTAAIHALDSLAPGPAVVAAPGPAVVAAPADPAPEASRVTAAHDRRVRSVLAALLAELKTDPELVSQVEELDARLAAALTTKQLPDLLAAITDVVGRRIQRIEHGRREAELLLFQMVGRLDEISQFVADQNQSQQQSLASSESLNTSLAGEMQAMGESVESAGELQQIRRQVRSRLDSISRHLQEYRQRQATRAAAIQARNEQMGSRVAELEAEAKRLHHQLKDEQRLAMIDVLTQIPNRLAYEKRIEDELQRCRRFEQPTCVAAWDIDHFKRINDAYGHRAGDRVLLTVARCLATRVRATDFVARVGGEEFVMIFTGAQIEDALRLSDQMREAVARLVFHFNTTAVSVTISCGVTALRAGDAAGAAFERADQALYQAKDRGRNRCVSA